MAGKKSGDAPVVNALDLGSGCVKFSIRNVDKGGDAESSHSFRSFPSLAPRYAGLELALPILGRRDTVVVNVEGTKYEVGPDAGDLDFNDSTRNLNDQYIHTDQYRALFYGALHYMAEDEIDLLVIGLPLSNMGVAGKLKDMTIGTHKINDSKTCVVKDAVVLPQPLGGLYYCLSQGGKIPEFEFMNEEMNLVIDPGFLTFDFLLSNGDKIVENKSGAHNGGVSKILRAIAESISTKHGIKYDNLMAIERGLKRGKIKINGEVENLDEHVRNAKSVLEGSVNYMKNIVGDGSDIDNIILLGGGAWLFEKTIKEYYPKHNVFVVEDAQLANVKGFQLAGNMYLLK